MNLINLKEKSIHGTEAFPVALYLSHWNIMYQWHPEEEIVLLLDGQMNYNINGETYSLKAGDCIYCPGGELHSMFLADRQRVTFYALLFKRSYLFDQTDPCCRLLAATDKRQRFFDHTKQSNQELITLVTKLCRCMSVKSYGYELDVKLQLMQFYQMLLKKYTCQTEAVSTGMSMRSDAAGILQASITSGRAASVHNDHNMIPAIAYIHEHYARQITVRQLADVTGYSTAYFESYFRLYTDVTPIQYVLLYRLKKACELLENTKYSVADISEMCGFSNVSYFIRRFGEVYHTSPLKYQKGFIIPVSDQT